MKGVFIPERWERIIDLVQLQGRASVEEIAQALGISPTTVRRDLARIHEKGLIERTRGGASPSPHVRVGPTLAESRLINPSEKELIGKAASSLVSDDDTLMIDGGFTTYQVSRCVQSTNLTIITNSLDVAQAFAARETTIVIVIGGELNSATGTLTGSVAEQQIRAYCADWAILGADAVSPEEGLTSPNPLTAQTKKAMIESSHGLIVVADHTKLGRFSPHRVAPCSAIGALVTDDRADPGIVEAFRDSGINVIVAGQAATAAKKGISDRSDTF